MITIVYPENPTYTSEYSYEVMLQSLIVPIVLNIRRKGKQYAAGYLELASIFVHSGLPTEMWRSLATVMLAGCQGNRFSGCANDHVAKESLCNGGYAIGWSELWSNAELKIWKELIR